MEERASMYLTFQWLPRAEDHLPPWWDPKRYEEARECPRTHVVRDGAQAASALRARTSEECVGLRPSEVGLLLSSGVDSGSLAYCVRPGTRAFFVTYPDAPTPEDPSMVERYARDNRLDLQVVPVGRADYTELMPQLMAIKKAPLHPCEVPIFKALQRARALGVKVMLAGWGCDTYFGGMDKLLSRDYPDAASFAARYTYCPPERVLRAPAACDAEFERYAGADGGAYRVQAFLNDNYHGMTMQCFFYLAEAAGLRLACPWGHVGLPGDAYDLARVRAGEPKYVVRDAFRALAPGVPLTDKVPFTRPDYADTPVTHPLFRTDLDWASLSPQQRWMCFALQEFLRANGH